MRTALFYDTETTGLPLFSEPSEDPRQPHIVQLAACLVDLDSRKTIASLDVIVKPDGWTIPEEVSKIHGIETEHAMAVGIPEVLAIELLLDLWRKRLRVAHNETFDARIVRIALMRHVSGEVADAWKSGSAQCTQALSTPICKIPPTAKMLAVGRKHHKSANLSEAYKFFTGEDLQDAHTAIADVQACVAVYFAVMDRQAAAAVAA